MKLKQQYLKVFSALFALFLSVSALAGAIEGDPFDSKVGYDLADYNGKITFLEFMDETLKDKMIELSDKRTKDNEAALHAGKGIAVKIDAKNFFYQVNYPNDEQGGRTFGWTEGGMKEDDWSDKKFLQNLDKTVRRDDKELHAFYKSIVQILGECDTSGYRSIKERHTEEVATNFLGIYAAEQYRALVGNSHWDDALLQVTLLGALHGGQSKLTKFYEGKFRDTAYDQMDRVYKRRGPGGRVTPDGDNAQVREAKMIDYWQFSKNRTSNRSGINLTRMDFKLMGKWITRYMRKVAKSQTVETIIRKTGGEGENVIEDISDYFIQAETPRLSGVDALANDIANFLVEVRANADEITKYTRANSTR